MKKWVTKISMILVVMAMCIVGFGSVPVYASMEDDAMDYTLGETYHGTSHDEVCYSFKLSKKSHVSFYMKIYGEEDIFTAGDYYYIRLYNSSGKKVFYGSNITWSKNKVSDTSIGRVSRTLNAGTYYLQMETLREYNFKITAEPLITLPKGTITSLKSNKAGQATVSCKAASNAIGYRIQYSTDYRFRKGVRTIYSPTRVKTLTRLTKGKRYYVRVCPYTVYDDGEHAFGANSYVKSVYVRKK